MATPVPFEVHHHRDAMDVTARLPGVRREDLRVDVTRDSLLVAVHSADGAEVHTLPLAAPIDGRRATMHFADGVLTLHLPKLTP
ncbi:MAG TPA: Hsp20/alpha crystallin family protein [Polyangiaceae bacterium]|jgi:HSP20 family molecular chaperone IbpA